jgi:hypothetical protein
MRLRHIGMAAVALCTTACMAFMACMVFAGTPTAWAATQHPAHDPAHGSAPVSVRTLPATTLTKKVTLPDTSMDSPALSSVFFAHIGSESALAWTGTDTAHHLNVETSLDGVTFGSKRILSETSPFRPDVGLSAPNSPVTVAWTGTDTHHSLNVLYDVYGAFGAPKKLTLFTENSFTAPALLVKPGSPGQASSSMFLAWTGTDDNHSLNILPITVAASGLEPGQKTTMSHFSSNAAPHLAWQGPNTSTPTVVLNWTSRALQLTLATSTDGVQFSPDQGVGLPETSAFAPQTVNITFFPGPPGPADWIGWTGTDAAHHLNLQSTTSFPTFTSPATTKIILSDTAFGGPSLAFNTDGQLAWTGTDAAHHLNIATFSVQ